MITTELLPIYNTTLRRDDRYMSKHIKSVYKDDDDDKALNIHFNMLVLRFNLLRNLFA